VIAAVAVVTLGAVLLARQIGGGGDDQPPLHISATTSTGVPQAGNTSTAPSDTVDSSDLVGHWEGSYSIARVDGIEAATRQAWWNFTVSRSSSVPDGLDFEGRSWVPPGRTVGLFGTIGVAGREVSFTFAYAYSDSRALGLYFRGTNEGGRLTGNWFALDASGVEVMSGTFELSRSP
jgi:hypothetical protein